MIRVRRFWLAPAFLLSILIYWLFFRPETLSYSPHSRKPLKGGDDKLHWKPHEKERYPVKGEWLKIPRGGPRPIPRIQFDFEVHSEAHEDKKKREDRLAQVQAEFTHAWEGYKKYAWAKDEVRPVTGSSRSSFGGWGATMVDSLDTLLIMGMDDEFEECVKVISQLDFTTNDEEILNVFETTIRYIGGLLSAYDLTNKKYKVLLKKAQELAEVVFTAFDTPNRMPNTRWEWRKSALGNPMKPSDGTLLAELGSMSLEFTRLTQLTGDPKYYDAVARISNALERLQVNTTIPGLWPTSINTKDLTATFNHFTMGGMSDSTYEYLPKTHFLIGGRTPQQARVWDRAIVAAKRYLFFRPLVPGGKDMLVSGDASADTNGMPILDPHGQHLTCFLPGAIGLAAKMFNEPNDLEIARRLLDGCIWAYNAMPSGLMPETFHMIPCHKGVGRPDDGTCTWNETRWYEAIATRHGGDASEPADPIEKGKHYAEKLGLQPGFVDYGDLRYMLRPEAIESLFVMYRITGDQDLQEHAWKMFQSIIKASRTEIAHAAVIDVRQEKPELNDRMESFWMAETLKYFYLMFSDPTLINLDKWVFNTEAHPFKKPPAPKDLAHLGG